MESVPPRAMTMVDVPKYKAYSKYNNAPGTGRTGLYAVPPNNYDFYTEEEKYKPQLTADGGVLSNWEPMYEPSTVKADADRLAAFEAGVPHGAGAVDAADATTTADATASASAVLREKYGEQCPTARLLVVSELHRDEEYGGPFWIEMPTKTRVHELRGVIAEHCGVLPGLQRLSFAGKKFEDPERNLEHYGVKYWNAKFPDWPVVIRRF